MSSHDDKNVQTQANKVSLKLCRELFTVLLNGRYRRSTTTNWTALKFGTDTRRVLFRMNLETLKKLSIFLGYP